VRHNSYWTSGPCPCPDYCFSPVTWSTIFCWTWKTLKIFSLKIPLPLGLPDGLEAARPLGEADRLLDDLVELVGFWWDVCSSPQTCTNNVPEDQDTAKMTKSSHAKGVGGARKKTKN
jgi:hypothetical protein